MTESFTVTIQNDDSLIQDTDNDGTPDEQENLAPNNGDGNRDGKLDFQQANVSSLLKLSGTTSDDIITIVSAPNSILRNVKITTENAVSEPEEKDITLPVGVLDFKLEGLTPGSATTVNLLLPQDQNYNTFWKYGKTPESNQDGWYEFLYDGETGAQFFDTNDDGKADQITLHFVDGKRGDADLTANGVIVDPGAPGVTNTSLNLSKSTNQDVWNIEGDAGVSVAKFSLVGKNSAQVNEVGVFKVNADNKVNSCFRMNKYLELRFT
ncbi:choice-of-anchor U domain-containing protein [Rivularia sp. UHCC 0363]|uniref:choice-of-anchor U domain-containing protein n=1 Tax=Rivularia sp. UHCC 0363 TaxID=3110244 RepID=UPI002B20110E|nr:choice-of-anchor U domain-containing protein [Rivularia sp. UHCC 0363]MEA5595937.1 choice-of-anchor U domain-containing protein [Rivularia sp. UHCC 0363]